MQDEMEDRYKDYFSFTHKELCDLLYTTEAKYNKKIAADQITILEASKESPDGSDSDTSSKVLRNK